MWTRKFWKDAAERATRTMVQAALAALAAQQTGLLETDWLAGGSTVLMAGLLSVLTSLLSQWPNPDGSASFAQLPGKPAEPREPVAAVPEPVTGSSTP